MVTALMRRHILKNRALILREAALMHDFMRLVMKRRNTGVKMTREEHRLFRSHVGHLALYAPALVIFLLPFGSLLLPVLAELLDRRAKDRITTND